MLTLRGSSWLLGFLKLELETKLRGKELLIERLERDGHWFAGREKEEREEKERGREAHEDEKVASPHSTNNNISLTQNLIAKV